MDVIVSSWPLILFKRPIFAITSCIHSVKHAIMYVGDGLLQLTVLHEVTLAR